MQADLKRFEAWFKKKEEDYREYLSKTSYSQNDIDDIVKKSLPHLANLVQRVQDCISTKDAEKQRDMLPLFLNLEKNGDTAYIFQEITGIKVGITNESGKRAFAEYFGDEVIKEMEEEAITEANRKREIEHWAKLNVYYEHEVFNKDSLVGVTERKQERLSSILDRFYVFKGRMGVTLKEHLEEEMDKRGVVSKIVTDNYEMFNEAKYEKMGSNEQKAYMDRLRKKRLYFIGYSNNKKSKIKKMVFDILNLPIDNRT